MERDCLKGFWIKNMNTRLPSTREFLREEVYLPGYMTLAQEDYDKKGGTFNFNVKEPPVARGNIVHYLTPRGLHICVSQAGYAIVEHMVNEGVLENLDIETLRDTLLHGRVKITELYQRFRREVELFKPVQGRFDITKLRLGRMPLLKLDFDLGNRAIQGNLVSVIVPCPMPQINSDLLRY